jgi:hypothetical protein
MVLELAAPSPPVELPTAFNTTGIPTPSTSRSTRPTHQRNASSLSSANIPMQSADSETEVVTPEEDWRRSQLLAGLNPSPISPAEDRAGRQSNFGEVFEEEEEEEEGGNGGAAEGSAAAQERERKKKKGRAKGEKADKVLGRE